MLSDCSVPYSYISDAVVAVCFCATLHRGSAWASRLFTLSWRQASELVKLLRSSAPGALGNIADKFNNVWGSRSVLTFLEGKGIALLGMVDATAPALAYHRLTGTDCTSRRREDELFG